MSSAMACDRPSPTLTPHLHMPPSCVTAGMRSLQVGPASTKFAVASRPYSQSLRPRSTLLLHRGIIFAPPYPPPSPPSRLFLPVLPSIAGLRALSLRRWPSPTFPWIQVYLHHDERSDRLSTFFREVHIMHSIENSMHKISIIICMKDSRSQRNYKNLDFT